MLSSHKNTVFETLERHPVHPFPARMAPGIALEALAQNRNSLRVLDPMAGSGTVLAVARAKGHHAYGIDMDPLAVLLARVWTRPINVEEVIEKAQDVICRARLVFDSLPASLAYPNGCDDETRHFVRYWFDEYARRQLSSLSLTISRVRNIPIREVLWCAFSRLIITKQAGASLAMDLSHSRPHKEFMRAPVKPFRKFIEAVEAVVSNCIDKQSKDIGPATVVKQGDARKLEIKNESIDLVLTSPPYLNAIDYLRCSKFSLVWMGYNVNDLRMLRAKCVGSEVSLDEASEDPSIKAVVRRLRLTPMLSNRNYALLAHYVWDMRLALKEVFRVLRPRGRAVYVVGDSTICGTFIRNSTIISTVAEENGLTLISRQSRALPNDRRYLPPPIKNKKNSGLNSRMRREVVLVLKKVAA
ncbi:MAG: hypothetical protein AB1560_02670 [Pseudomonadota bacterium]